MEIDDRTVIERAADPPEVAFSATELVLLDVTGGHYHTLQGAAAIRIWQLLATPQSLAALLDLLCGEFDIDRRQCREETVAFLGVLAAKGLVRIARP